jgi:hypothetical protein
MYERFVPMPERYFQTHRLLAGALVLASTFGCSSEPLRTTESDSGGSPASDDGEMAPVILEVLSRVAISSDPEAEHHRHAEGDVNFGGGEVERATRRVTLESPCFPFEGWSELQIPSGHNWPLQCDAFDRGLSLTLDPGDDEGDPPALELLRAVTPFGGPLQLETDVTDVVNGLPGQHRMRLRIDTWGDAEGQVSGARGEWLASVELRLEPGPAPRRVLEVRPLVYESQTSADAAELSFAVPDEAGSARLEYRVTGHGGVQDLGCRGPAEEFCQRTHELRLDGELLELLPWRSDCAALCTLTENDAPLGPPQYCAENPCGAPASVRAPRANWCPGSETPPLVLEPAALTMPGEHALGRRIPELREGGSWMVSLSYFAFE